MYGLDRPETREYGTRLLIARRLVERGVRFVQIFIAGQIWDLHANLRGGLAACCEKTDKPAAALVTDLKQRGLLDTTIVHWGGEIGRLPVTQTAGDPSQAGRDHNGQGFSIWLAGGGIKGGMTYGADRRRRPPRRRQSGQPERLPCDAAAPVRHRPRPPHVFLQRPRPHADGRSQVPRGAGNPDERLEVRLLGGMLPNGSAWACP